jgi:hypothetical protein
MEANVTLVFRYFIKDNLRHHFFTFCTLPPPVLEWTWRTCQDVFNGVATLLVQSIYTSIALMESSLPYPGTRWPRSGVGILEMVLRPGWIFMTC